MTADADRSRLLDSGHAAAEINTFESSGHGDKTLEVFAANFRFAGSFRDCSERAEGCVFPVVLTSRVLLMRSSVEHFLRENGRGLCRRDH